MRKVSLCAVLAGAVCIACPEAVLAAPEGIVHTVVIEGMQFVPARLEVRAGDTIVWQNKDPFPHTASSSGEFDSGSIQTGKSWKFVTKRDGAFPYICDLHPTMRAELVVRPRR